MSNQLKVTQYSNANAFEATWIDASGAVVRCHAYDATQVQMFLDDVAQLGGVPADYESVVSSVLAAYTPPPEPSIDDLRSALTGAVTSVRWQKETGGVMLPGGVVVGTTLDDQNRITSVIANAALAGVESVDFKTETGWVTLAIQDLRGIAAAIATHVQACFSAERAHHEAIAKLTDRAALAAYNINDGWPQ